MPIVSPGYARAVGVGLLVAARTVQSGNAFALRTPNYVGEVTLTAIPLLWVIGGCVTVDAARMDQNRIDLLPGGKAGAMLRTWQCAPETNMPAAEARKKPAIRSPAGRTCIVSS